jgi:branched-chain amino acid transport system substrate-binding protein
MSIRRKALALVAGLAIIAAACGGSDDSGSSSDTTSASGGSGGGSDATFDGPLKIATLWEVSGESAVGINDYENAAQLALEEINDAGGVGGFPVELNRVATPVLDFQKTQAAFLEAVDSDPAMIVGFALPAQVQATSQQITRSQIPVLAVTNGQPFLRFDSADSSPYLWGVKTYDPSIVTAGVNYMVEELGLTEIGIMATNETNGAEAVKAATAALAEHDLQPYAVAEYPPTATDLTPQVLQMQGADGVVHWGFPNTLPVQLTQFVANGLDIPTMSNDSAGIAVASGLVSGPPIAKLYVSGSCNPGDPQNSVQSDFADNYKAKYGTNATVSAGIVYDAIYLAVAAAEMAGSTDPEAINEVMPDVTRPEGACGVYQPDPAHMMNHEQMTSKYNVDGTSEVLDITVIPPQEKQS